MSTQQIEYGGRVNGVAVHQEIERKLDVPARFRLPELPHATALPHLVLTATYYDTDDLRLARHRITMRRRTGGGDDGWHLKLPGTDDATRDELHLPLDTPGEPPQAFVNMVQGITRGAPLAPVATLRNQRRPVALLDVDGTPLAELTDDHVSVLVDGKVRSRFREIEVEAAAGRIASDLDSIVDTLIAAGAKQASFASKAVRALGPRATELPDVGLPPIVGADDPAADALHAHIMRQVAIIQWQDLCIRRGLPDAVHQMRVALRRLRSALKVFECLFVHEWAEPLRDELGVVAEALGVARDTEVLEARLLNAVGTMRKVTPADRQAAEQEVRTAMSRSAARGRTRAAAALDSPRYTALLDALVEAAHSPHFTAAADASCREVLLPLVRDAWNDLADDVNALHRKGADEPWHRARIRAKRVRYAVDVLVPVFGKPATKFELRLSTITELLGQHQDASIASVQAHTIATHPKSAGAAGFVLGRLHAAMRAEVRQVRRDFLDTWPKVADPRLRRWLRKQESR